MSRRLKIDLSGIDPRVPVERAADRDWPAHFAKDLETPLPLVVELGFGRGEFLLHLARESPERAHVGVEVSYKRVLKMAHRVARAELANVRLVNATGEQFVRECLAPDSVERVWINFSDPWPKRRHHPRRLIQRALIGGLCEALRTGATIEVATDDVPYAEHIDATLRGEARLMNAFAPDRWRAEVADRLPTAYELEWRAEGRPLHFWSYVKR